jgi:hypothetical protein
MKYERVNLEDLDVDGRITLRYIEEIEWKSVDWVYLSEDGNPWRILRAG